MNEKIDVTDTWVAFLLAARKHGSQLEEHGLVDASKILSIIDRQKVVPKLIEQGFSQTETAAIVGVDEATVRRDLGKKPGDEVSARRRKQEEKNQQNQSQDRRGAEPDGVDAMKAAHADNEIVEEPETLKANLLRGIRDNGFLVNTWSKVIKSSTLDRAAKDEVSTALGGLITKVKSLQTALRGREKSDGEEKA